MSMEGMSAFQNSVLDRDNMNPSRGITFQPRNSVIWNMMLCASGHLIFPRWFLSLRFLHRTLYAPLLIPNMCHITRNSHFSRFDHTNNIWWGTQITKLTIMPSLWVTYYVVPLRPKYLPQRPIFKGLKLGFSFNAWGLVSPHNKTTGQIILLYILTFFFLLIKRYNLCKVLTFSNTFFQLSLFCTNFFQVRTFMLFISSKTSSSQCVLGLPIGLLDMGYHLLIFCTLLSSAMRSTWPNQFNVF
jgi:hypothetical protein